MPTKTYVHPFAYGSSSDILDFKTYAVRQKLPTWRQCQDPKPPFITFGETNWNCIKCEGEPAYFLPVNSADQYQFQFQFDDYVNTDPTNPAFGWLDSGTGLDPYQVSARVLDCDCVVVPGFELIDSFASDYGVAYSEAGGSMQWLNVDIGSLPSELCCFFIEVTLYYLVEGTPTALQIVTAGPYRRNDGAECLLCPEEDDTILICGTWKKEDCWSRRYDVEFGTGDELFMDCIRVVANIKYLGTSSEGVFDGEVEVKTVQKTKYSIEFGGMPPLIASWVSTILASNNFLSIGGYEINRANGDTVGSFEQQQQGTGMFYGSVEFTLQCEIHNFGCN